MEDKNNDGGLVWERCIVNWLQRYAGVLWRTNKNEKKGQKPKSIDSRLAHINYDGL